MSTLRRPEGLEDGARALWGLQDALLLFNGGVAGGRVEGDHDDGRVRGSCGVHLGGVYRGDRVSIRLGIMPPVYLRNCPALRSALGPWGWEGGQGISSKALGWGRGASSTPRAVEAVVLLRPAVLARELDEGAGWRALELSWEVALKSRTGGVVSS